MTEEYTRKQELRLRNLLKIAPGEPLPCIEEAKERLIFLARNTIGFRNLKLAQQRRIGERKPIHGDWGLVGFTRRQKHEKIQCLSCGSRNQHEGENIFTNKSTQVAGTELLQRATCIFCRNEQNFIHEVTYREEKSNLVLDPGGRANSLGGMFDLTGAAPYVALAFGSDNGTLLTLDESNVRLGSELIGNATRIPLTDTSGGTLTLNNLSYIIADTSVPPYRRKIAVQGYLDFVDGNNPCSIAEWGLNTTTTLPGSPTTQSGMMLNRFIPGSPMPKSIANAVTATATIRE